MAHRFIMFMMYWCFTVVLVGQVGGVVVNLTPAHRLAALINANRPVDVAKEMSLDDLQLALGQLQDTELGWRKRTGSFFAHLNFNQPEYYEEAVLATESHAFTSPLLIQRKEQGVSGYLAKRLKSKNVLKKNIKVQPSRCSSLALNYNDSWPTINPATTTWDKRLQPFTPCPACRIPFQKFHALSLRPFHLTTPASDPGNIQLQTHGIQGRQIKPLRILFKKHRNRPNAMYSHVNLRQSFFTSSCRNAPAMGFAASLRGLAFHKHQANLNEVVIGRKLWMIFPPRSMHAEPHAPCPWPPWSPNGEELNKDNSHIERILRSFFYKKPFNATGSGESEESEESEDSEDSEDRGKRGGGATGKSKKRRKSTNALRSCFDQNMTPLQWLVYEYPRMKADHRPFMFVVNPGQVVWIPDDWPHATINIDDVWYVHKGSCADQRQQRLDRSGLLKKAVQRTCDTTGRFCTGYCFPFCKKCKGYETECGLVQKGDKEEL